MKKALTIALLALGFAVPASAQTQQCTVPNTLANGQVADASEVMDNFNAVAACVDTALDDTVTHEGAPDTGEIAVFGSPTSVTGGDLTGDVTTSGGTTTTLSASGVAPGTYYNSTITVDAKGRVTSATNRASLRAFARDRRKRAPRSQTLREACYRSCQGALEAPVQAHSRLVIGQNPASQIRLAAEADAEAAVQRKVDARCQRDPVRIKLIDD